MPVEFSGSVLFNKNECSHAIMKYPTRVSLDEAVNHTLPYLESLAGRLSLLDPQGSQATAVIKMASELREIANNIVYL